MTMPVAYDEGGKPFRVTVTTYPADRNQFVIEVGKVAESSSPPHRIGHPSPPQIPTSPIERFVS